MLGNGFDAAQLFKADIKVVGNLDLCGSGYRNANCWHFGTQFIPILFY